MMLSIALTSLLALFQLTTLSLGQQGEECGGPLSFIPFDNITYGIEYYCRCTYFTNKLNSSCILSSCPLLSGVCPLTSDTALNNTVSILTSCLGQKGLICGLNMSRIPIVQIAWTTAELVPKSLASGNIMLNPGTGYISNIPNTKFTVSQPAGQNGPITLTIEAINITSIVDCNCNFSIPSTSLLSTLKPFGPFPMALSSPLNFLNTPHMQGFYHLNVTTTVSIDLNAQPPTVKTLNYQFNIESAFYNFVTLSGMSLIPEVEKLFNEGMQTFFKFSVIPSTVTNFLSTYATLALQAAQMNCPS